MTKHRNSAYSEEYRREAFRRSELPNQTTVSCISNLILLITQRLKVMRWVSVCIE
ncbi:hypothetical protein [Neptunomonas japonica]|uniref:hypothetical protein n=1 Tax=Neptunomonas japonica TaxID=417574 RepID=UPI001915871C|nr:hypothetical protein [Neptunomonas japonica]